MSGKRMINEGYIFDGFMHWPYDEDRDGYLKLMPNQTDYPSVQMAYDVLALFEENKALIEENWHLKKRLEIYEKDWMKWD